MTGAPRVLIADDHAPTRAGVRSALERGGCSVCAEAATAPEAVDAAVHQRPDVCLIDLRMPGDGLSAVTSIAAQLPDTLVLVLTVSASPDDLFAALSAGASGYLLKDADPDDVALAVHDVLAGAATLPGHLTARLIEEFRRRADSRSLMLDHSRRVELTPREWEVLQLLDEGLSTAGIATRLSVSQVTVRRHVSALLHKLEVGSREEARRMMRGHGRSDRLNAR